MGAAGAFGSACGAELSGAGSSPVPGWLWAPGAFPGTHHSPRGLALLKYLCRSSRGSKIPWLNLIPEHAVLGTAPGTGQLQRGGSRIPLHCEAPSTGGSAAGLGAERAQGPSSPSAVLEWWGQLLTTSSRAEELREDLTAEAPPAQLTLPHTAEFCVQNSLNPGSGSTSCTCPHSVCPAGSRLKGEGATAPKHTALYRTTHPGRACAQQALNPPECQQGK